ncbi:hypothetical protein FI667_g3061, partial [Globisporangium splendens]
MSPIRGGGGVRTRKITVNERVEQILQGSLQVEEVRSIDNPATHNAAMARSHELSNLYSASTEGRQQDASTPSSSQQQRTRRVPPIAIVPQGRVVYSDKPTDLTMSPIKPVRCLSQQMLELQRQEEERNAKREDPVLTPSPVNAKPWYKVCRYGAYGTIKMMASETSAGTAPPFCLHESQSLDSIAFKNDPNAWSPSLHGSPTLWPEDSNYATGSILESHVMIRCPSPDFRFPTHSVGVVEDDNAQETIDLEHAFDSEKALQRKEIAYSRNKLELWKSNLHFEPLSSKMDHPFIKVNAKRATQATILHTPEYSPNSKFHAQVEKLTEERFPLRWRNMAILLDIMRRTPCRRPVLQDIEKLFALACEVSYKNANPFELSRQQYWDILQKEYPSVEIRHANRLFSSYDYKMKDRMDVRVFLGTIRALRVQQDTPLEILCLSLQDFGTTERGIVTSLDTFQAALMCCCSHEDEEKQMQAQATALWKQMGIDFQIYQSQHH